MDTRLLWLALGGFVGGNESFVLNGLLPEIGADMGVTVGVAGYAVFAYSLVYAIATPVFSAVLGPIDRRTVLVAAELTVACGIALAAVAPSLPVLVAARVIIAMGAGLFTATAIATAVGMSPPERRGRAIAVVAGGQSLAVLVGVPLGAWIASAYGWRTIYVVLAMLAVAAALGMLLRLPSGLFGDRLSFRQRLGVVKLPGIPIAYFATLVFMLSAFLPIIFIAPLAAEVGIGRDLLPLALFANGVGAVAGAQTGGRMADRLGAGRALRFAGMAQVVLLLALGGCVMLPDEIAGPVFFLLVAAIGFVGWSYWPSQSSLIAGLAPAAPAIAISFSLTALNIGVALSARIGGVVVDSTSLVWLPLIGVLFAAAAVVALSVLLRRTTHH